MKAQLCDRDLVKALIAPLVDIALNDEDRNGIVVLGHSLKGGCADRFLEVMEEVCERQGRNTEKPTQVGSDRIFATYVDEELLDLTLGQMWEAGWTVPNGVDLIEMQSPPRKQWTPQNMTFLFVTDDSVTVLVEEDPIQTAINSTDFNTMQDLIDALPENKDHTFSEEVEEYVEEHIHTAEGKFRFLKAQAEENAILLVDPKSQSAYRMLFEILFIRQYVTGERDWTEAFERITDELQSVEGVVCSAVQLPAFMVLPKMVDGRFHIGEEKEQYLACLKEYTDHCENKGYVPLMYISDSQTGHSFLSGNTKGQREKERRKQRRKNGNRVSKYFPPSDDGGFGGYSVDSLKPSDN